MRMGRTPQLKSSVQDHDCGREAETNDPWQESDLERLQSRTFDRGCVRGSALVDGSIGLKSWEDA